MVSDQVLSDLVITFLFCIVYFTSHLCLLLLFSCVTVCLLFLTLLVLRVAHISVALQVHAYTRRICAVHDDNPFAVMCFLFNMSPFNICYFIEEKENCDKKNLCMPLVDFETFTLVLLALCSNNSGTRSQPSINRGHNNKRTKHNLHSGGI